MTARVVHLPKKRERPPDFSTTHDTRRTLRPSTIFSEQQPMASNFNMQIRTNGTDAHIDLRGNFDGTSACMLLSSIRKHKHYYRRVFVHTHNLQRIYLFGKNVLLNNIDMPTDDLRNVIFDGEHAAEIAPPFCPVR
jgi:hypothetical protein